MQCLLVLALCLCDMLLMLLWRRKLLQLSGRLLFISGDNDFVDDTYAEDHGGGGGGGGYGGGGAGPHGGNGAGGKYEICVTLCCFLIRFIICPFDLSCRLSICILCRSHIASCFLFVSSLMHACRWWIIWP